MSFVVQYGLVVARGISSRSGEILSGLYTVAEEENTILCTQNSCITQKSVILPQILFE